MVLYHVTKEPYNVGDVISIDDFTNDTCYYNDKDDLHKEVNQKMDDMRPAGEPRRAKCIYACDKFEHCCKFAELENMFHDGCHFYEIEMDALSPHPINLVDKIFQNRNAQNIDKLIDIYWQPQTEWFYTEYLGTRMTILREIPQEEIDKIRNDIPGRNDYRCKFIDDLSKAINCADKICTPPNDFLY